MDEPSNNPQAELNDLQQKRLEELLEIATEHGLESDPVRQYILSQRGQNGYDQFEILALTTIALMQGDTEQPYEEGPPEFLTNELGGLQAHFRKILPGIEGEDLDDA